MNEIACRIVHWFRVNAGDKDDRLVVRPPGIHIVTVADGERYFCHGQDGDKTEEQLTE